MKLKQLLEIPELRNKNARFNPDPEICMELKSDPFKNYPGLPIENNIEASVLKFGNQLKVYLVLNENTKFQIIGKFEGVKVQLHSTYQEESIDVCEKFRKKGYATKLYLSLLKSGLNILSDFKHYPGTKGLWKKLYDNGVLIQVFDSKTNSIISDDYNLDDDDLKVWSSNKYLLLATTKKNLIDKHVFENLIRPNQKEKK